MMRCDGIPVTQRRAPRGWTWLLLSIIFQSAAAACAKQAGLSSAGKPHLAIMTCPWWHLQIACLALQACCWVMVLRRLPLSFAYPLMSLVFAINLVSARLLFGEVIHLNQTFGIGIIMAGVLIVARGGFR